MRRLFNDKSEKSSKSSSSGGTGLSLGGDDTQVSEMHSLDGKNPNKISLSNKQSGSIATEIKNSRSKARKIKTSFGTSPGTEYMTRARGRQIEAPTLVVSGDRVLSEEKNSLDKSITKTRKTGQTFHQICQGTNQRVHNSAKRV